MVQRNEANFILGLCEIGVAHKSITTPIVGLIYLVTKWLGANQKIKNSEDADAHFPYKADLPAVCLVPISSISGTSLNHCWSK